MIDGDLFFIFKKNDGYRFPALRVKGEDDEENDEGEEVGISDEGEEEGISEE